MRPLAFFGLLAMTTLPACAQEALKVTLQPSGDTYRMFTRGENAVTLKLATQSSDGKAHRASVQFTVEDIFGQPVKANLPPLQIEVPADGKKVEQSVPFDAGLGYFRVTATGEGVSATTDFGVLPPPHSGVRPDSFFSSNTSGLRRGSELDLLRKIGMKVQRAHLQPSVQGNPPAPTGAPLSLNFANQDKAWAESKAAGIWVLPIAGYAFEKTVSDIGQKTGMYGPPRDYQEFVATWEQILRHYPEVTTYEFWNEPWIFGWTWAANAEEYRKLQKMWCEMALRVNPKLRLIAGNSSMFTEDHIEAYPDSWLGYLQGTTHHPYSFSTGQPTLRAGDVGRSTDHGMQVTRRMGLPFYYLTEGGTEYPAGGPHTAHNNNQNAFKLVQYNVRSALLGTYQGNSQWDIGYGPEWTKSNTAFATMTHFLEDRPIVADIWPKHELIWGAIFANARHVTDEVKALPRAKELSSRWNVPVPAARANDVTKVAVFWCQTGTSNTEVDTGGTLTMDARGLAAFDIVGRPIASRGSKLVLPFNEHPVYVTSDTLGVVELRERIAGAKIENVTPMNVYALSLARPASEVQTLAVRLENQLNRPVKGTLSLQAGGKQTQAKFETGASELVEIAVPWPGVASHETNQYGVTLTAKTDAGNVSRQQIVSVARFVKKTIPVDGTSSGWENVAPVLIDSDRFAPGVDLTQYLLNPHLEKPTGEGDKKRVVARVYTAYDDDNVYVAAAVNEDSLMCTAGRPVVKGRREDKVELPYREGMPDGLNHIRNCGDVFSFAFGFRERVPGWGRQMDDPYAWKGQFYDTDYHYVAHTSTDGPLLMRQWGPGTGRRTAYQTAVVPGYGPVPGAQLKINRDEAAKLTLYEIAIPRREMTLFDPAAGRCRFGFFLENDEKVGPLYWSEAAGVFDHWRSAGSFGPSWMQVLPCQTFWGIDEK